MIDQGKSKKKEQRWFNKLEEELDRVEIDESLLRYKLEHTKKKIKYDDQLNKSALSEA